MKIENLYLPLHLAHNATHSTKRKETKNLPIPFHGDE